jgi:hypothetical protein
MSGALHGASAVGSGLDILSSVAPEATRMGMRQIGGPLAKYGMAVGDIYDELKNGEYGKAAITLGATPMFNSALTTPLGIAALYYRDRPEEFKKAIHTPEPKKPFRYRGFGLD